MNRATSYRPASCHGEDCAYGHTDPRPCWGQVEYEDEAAAVIVRSPPPTQETR